MLNLLCFASIVTSALACSSWNGVGHANLEGQELVDYVNNAQNLWTAQLNPRFADVPDSILTGMLGLKKPAESARNAMPRAESRLMDIELPKRFDPRDKWPECKDVIENIRDHGHPAWPCWQTDGIVTGSNYTAKSGCKPYAFPPCEHHTNKTTYPKCSKEDFPTPKCEKKCQDSYNKSYAEDKYYGLNFYQIGSTVEEIQKELIVNGPTEVSFMVYKDFFHYNKGIYQATHTAGAPVGGHAVRLVGWGEENGTPYWFIANSWNSDWGENGFFRIVRGKDECGIESSAIAGLPKLTEL